MTVRRRDERGLRISKTRRRPSKPSRELPNLPDPLFDQVLLGKQTWLTVPQAAAYLQFPSDAAMREWASRHRIRKGRRGRTLVFRRTHLDEAVQPAGKA